MSTRKLPGTYYDRDTVRPTDDALTEEAALHICVNGETFSTTMRTPGHDELLVRGMLYTEGIVRDPGASMAFSVVQEPESRIVARMDVTMAPEVLLTEIAGRRTGVSVSSCGLCGTARPRDIEIYGQDVRLPTPRPLPVDALAGYFEQMAQHQSTFDRSGGSHAAAIFSANGTLLSTHEDIGRHNAVDKTVGALLSVNGLEMAHCMIVSGRCSYEIVLKAYRAGIPFLAAVSAPSTLAVETAQQVGMTLLAFCRNGRATAYSNTHQLTRRLLGATRTLA